MSLVGISVAGGVSVAGTEVLVAAGGVVGWARASVGESVMGGVGGAFSPLQAAIKKRVNDKVRDKFVLFIMCPFDNSGLNLRESHKNWMKKLCEFLHERRTCEIWRKKGIINTPRERNPSLQGRV